MGFFLLPYECICLLGVGLLSSIAAFSYFPFATTVLPTYLGATSAQVAAIIGFAVFAGNVGAYFVSIYSNANNLLQRLRSSLLMIAASLLIMVLAHAAGSTYQAAVATISLIMYRYAIGMVSNTSRALQIKFGDAKSHDRHSYFVGICRILTNNSRPPHLPTAFIFIRC
jgi:hypothetical protein